MPYCETRQHNPDVVAHIDGDYMAYFSAGNDNCSPGDARRNVISRVDRLKSISGAGKVVMHLSHPASNKGERFLIATTKPYQGQRKSGKKPRNWEFLRGWLENYDGLSFTPKVWKDREADDGIAYVCDAVARNKGILHVVHTADKDMRMFCGTHVSWDKFIITDVPRGSFDIIGKDGEQYGHKWFWMQMLTGDTADHIPGLPGIGDAIAGKIIDGAASNAEARASVIGAYRDKCGSEWADYFVEQAALLWMRTDRYAQVDNFLSLGFGDEVHNASKRMLERVSSERKMVAQYATN